MTLTPAATCELGPSNPTLALFLISFLGLFLELLLIRWISTEINIFAYLQNTVLVVCFMGFAMGCMTSGQPIALRKGLTALFFLILLLAIPASRQAVGKISWMLSALGDLVLWNMAISSTPLQTIGNVSIGLTATFFLMVLICACFVPIGRILGRLMQAHQNPIWAYSVNIVGSLIGIWCFTLLSVYYQPPFIWLFVVAACFAAFVVKSNRESIPNFCLLIGVIALAWFAGRDPSSKELLWSPYQKLALHEMTGEGPTGNYAVSVNNTFYLVMSNNNRGAGTRSWRQLYPEQMEGLSQYDIPLLLHRNPRKVLVVGAGGGNDVAGALRHGASEITAVEIDPAIIDLGRKYHSEQPYASPRVTVINDDARSFFATAQQRYDLIIFGLLDSHTTTAMTNARLDHYVYTREALATAKTLLLPGGIISLAFEATKPFIADRMATMLREIFDQDPLTFQVPVTGYGPGGRLFIVGNLDMARSQISSNARLTALIASLQQMFPMTFSHATSVTTDDWPYLYLSSRTIPILYYFLACLIIALLFYGRWRFNLGSLFDQWGTDHWHFFFLGAGFLLLEVQNISKAAVVLGNTWSVNAVIISGILVMVLIANFIALKFPRAPMSIFYTGLLAACMALYFLDLSQFAFLPYFEKATLVGLLAGAPVFFSGVIFVRSFSITSARDTALGANLIGAMLGGVLQSLTFVTGIKALLLIVAVFYSAALVFHPSAGQRIDSRQA